MKSTEIEYLMIGNAYLMKLSILQSNKGFYLYVCMCVCVCLHNSGTAGPIWLNLFLLALSWSRDGFRPKKFRIRDPVFRKSGKTRILGYYLTNLAKPFFVSSVLVRKWF